MTEQEFADRENWLGSFYEMGIEYAPGTSGQQLLAAIEAPWQHPLLEGPVIGPYSDHAPALTPTRYRRSLRICLVSMEWSICRGGERSVASHSSWVLAPIRLKKSRRAIHAG